MKRYLRNRWIQVGLVLVVFGWGPLITVGVLAEIGLWPDPNPNPIGLGLLFAVTSWPAIGCLSIGYARVRKSDADASAAQRPPSANDALAARDTQPMRERLLARGSTSRTTLRVVAGIVGFIALTNGVSAVILGITSRGAGSAIVVGALALYWAIFDQLPRRLRLRR